MGRPARRRREPRPCQFVNFHGCAATDLTNKGKDATVVTPNGIGAGEPIMKWRSAVALQYTKHARDQMARRGISENEVEAVLSDPAVRYTDKKGNPIFRADVEGRRIKVVVAKGTDPPRVITAAD